MIRLSSRIRVWLLFGVAACALAALAMAESTPSPYQLIDAHFAMSVTLLANGEVLIVGGGDSHVFGDQYCGNLQSRDRRLHAGGQRTDAHRTHISYRDLAQGWPRADRGRDESHG